MTEIGKVELMVNLAIAIVIAFVLYQLYQLFVGAKSTVLDWVWDHVIDTSALRAAAAQEAATGATMGATIGLVR